MSIDTPQSGETVTLEVSGGKISLLRTLLEKEELDESLERVRIELEWAEEEATDGKQSPSADESTDTDTSTPKTPPAPDRIRDGLTPDKEEVTQKRNSDPEVISNEPEITYPDNPSLTDLPDVSLRPGTAKWAVVAALYTHNGYHSSKRIERLLEGTELEQNLSTLTSSITYLKDDGVICYRKGTGPNGKREYQLTQFGRDLAEAVADKHDIDISLS